jgi:hypothetical protein
MHDAAWRTDSSGTGPASRPGAVVDLDDVAA